MSVGRPDPSYVPKLVSPEEYNRNKASIEAARVKLEEYTRMNEVGRKNFELMEQEKREEHELAQKIQEGELAKQRLQQLRKRRSLAITNGEIGSSSRIEDAGNSHTGETASFQQNSVPYSQSLSQPMRQTTSSYDGSSSYAHPGHIQQPPYTASQPYLGSSQVNPNKVPQNQYSTRPPNYQSYYQRTQQTQASSSRQSLSGQQPLSAFQPQTYQTAPEQNSRSMHYHRPYEVPDSSASSLVGALGPKQPTASSSRDAGQNPSLSSSLPSPLLDILMPAYPTVAQLQTIKQYLNQWASVVPPQTQYGATIIWDTYSVKCFKSKDSIIVFAIETPTGTIEAAAHGILDDLLAKAGVSQATTNGDTSIRSVAQNMIHESFAKTPTTTAPIVQDNSLSTNKASNPASQIPSAASSYTQDRTVPQTSVPPIPPAASAAMFPISQTLQQRANHAYVSPSATHITANTQAIPSPAPTPSTVSRATTAPSTVSNVPALPQGPLTPTKQSTSEQSTAGITPQQADKKRIAQSLLWALGKRPRESPSDSESQSSKKRAIEANQVQNVPNEAQSTSSTSHTDIRLASAMAPDSQKHADSPNVPQNSTRPPDAGAASNASTQAIPPTDPPRPSDAGVVSNTFTQAIPLTDPQHAPQSNTQPAPTVSTSDAKQPMLSASMPTNVLKYYPKADYNAIHPKTQSASAPVAPKKSVRDTQPGSSSQVPPAQLYSFDSVQPLATPTTQLPTSTPVSTPSYTYVMLAHPQTAMLRPVSYMKPEQSTAASSSHQTAGKSGSNSSEVSIEAAPKSTAAHIVRDDQKTYSRTSTGSSAPRKSTASPRPSTARKASPNQGPLFLPSSSPESGPSFSRRQSETPVSTGSNVKKATRRIENRAFVMVPPAPDYLVRYHKQLHRKQARGMREKEDPVSLPEPAFEGEDFWYTFESQRGSSSDENEREAIRLACSRLYSSPCRWDGCDAIMNSGEALIRHLNLHKPEPSQNARTFMCRWTQCGQQGVRFEDSQHLKKHALLPLRCAYKDCKDSFRSGGQLLKHFRRRHADGTLKPSAKPEPPMAEGAADLPNIPEPFPSYLLSTDLARGEVLSEERHRLVGQQVLMNITFVDDGAPLERRSKKTARPASRPLPDPTAHLTSDYQFLLTKDSARSSTYSSMACDIDHEDLDSAQISRIVKEGLVLWGSDEAVAAPPDSPLFSPEPPQQLLDAETKLGAETGTEPSYDRSDSGSVGRKPRFDDFHTSDVEDAAVENMLTDIDIDLTLTS